MNNPSLAVALRDGNNGEAHAVSHTLRPGDPTPAANGAPALHLLHCSDHGPRTTDHGEIRVTHLGKFFHPAHGGIERTVRSLAHAQARIGCSVRVICMDHERGRATRVEQDGPVEVVRVRRAAVLRSSTTAPTCRA